ncbi:chromosome-partitioning ATPase Soj [Variibacter gotjawalensis]|uniref:Chromosome-partitioning ATPase Soj n=1 Tax=Variibacter gotjawalensis TaxID=1333996 RepID=A0A0S3PSC5_9BRAD|nr:ParA family protein [Variibacter gotjawalensis]NIK49062.1 chromosome partitioning protein [Variibacter gotjawalensis]RZS50918.1 chromosome partitioning protein [Variibacter gotjawalensis]BAT58752.1 chromosome-partitioning ATPase Soj [Variibacter gotjawalensis]
MNVLVFAARKGGSGKSTLTAHLAASRPAKSCLLIDCDPQGSLTLWHKLRNNEELTIRSGLRGVGEIIKSAKKEGFEWVMIDTPPNMSSIVTEAIRAATMVVIPARPTVFDLTSVAETIALCRDVRKPYAVVINGAPAKREGVESPIVSQARAGLSSLNVPLWHGQITNRTNFALSLADGEGVREYDASSFAAAEIAGLWTAIEKSVKVINGASGGSTGVMHKVAA